MPGRHCIHIGFSFCRYALTNPWMNYVNKNITGEHHIIYIDLLLDKHAHTDILGKS